MVCGSEPRRGNPATRTYRDLNHRATSRLYWPEVNLIKNTGLGWSSGRGLGLRDEQATPVKGQLGRGLPIAARGAPAVQRGRAPEIRAGTGEPNPRYAACR